MQISLIELPFQMTASRSTLLDCPRAPEVICRAFAAICHWHSRECFSKFVAALKLLAASFAHKLLIWSPSIPLSR
jgi:hypothetical protein